jgi:Dpy-30 motif
MPGRWLTPPFKLLTVPGPHVTAFMRKPCARIWVIYHGSIVELLPTLQEMVREKPEEPVKWLGEFLLANAPAPGSDAAKAAAEATAAVAAKSAGPPQPSAGAAAGWGRACARGPCLLDHMH